MTVLITWWDLLGKIGCQRWKNGHLTPIKFSKFIFPTKPLLLRSAKNIDSRSSILANNCEKMVFFGSKICFLRLFWAIAKNFQIYLAFGMLDFSLPWNFLSYRAKSTSFFVLKTSKNPIFKFFFAIAEKWMIFSHFWHLIGILQAIFHPTKWKGLIRKCKKHVKCGFWGVLWP